jgi:hypothetical protein
LSALLQLIDSSSLLNRGLSCSDTDFLDLGFHFFDQIRAIQNPPAIWNMNATETGTRRSDEAPASAADRLDYLQ